MFACLQGVSNIAWALATAGHRDDALFEKLLSHCMADISSYDVQVRIASRRLHTAYSVFTATSGKWRSLAAHTHGVACLQPLTCLALAGHH